MKTDAEDETKSVDINGQYNLNEKRHAPNTKKPAVGWFFIGCHVGNASVNHDLTLYF